MTEILKSPPIDLDPKGGVHPLIDLPADPLERLQVIANAIRSAVGTDKVFSPQIAIADAVDALNPTGPARSEGREADLEALVVGITDPTFVHVNMLRGSIAKPSIVNIIHLYGEKALRAALPPEPACSSGEGGVLVPVEPTEAMIDAAVQALGTVSEWSIRTGYEAMVAAALSQPVSGVE